MCILLFFFQKISQEVCFIVFFFGLIWFTLPIQSVHAQICRFQDPHPAGNVIEYWRLTHDPAIRDHANYHNTNCWSSVGRYICYTHYAQNANEIHIINLHTGKNIFIDTGSNPRWAKRHDWPFYTKRNRDAGPRWGKGTEVIRYDVQSEIKQLITWGIEFLGSTDRNDRWIYGSAKIRVLKRYNWYTARATIERIRPGRKYKRNHKIKQKKFHIAYKTVC